MKLSDLLPPDPRRSNMDGQWDMLPGVPLLLSVFSGGGLFDWAFEECGFCVVQGPEKLWGRNISGWKAPGGVFTGLVGGPPCQPFSMGSNMKGTQAVDMIPEFVRLYHELKPQFVVMENLDTPDLRNHPAIPTYWHRRVLRDWDCGGHTIRRRSFWSYPFTIPSVPRRSGKPELSVLASTWKSGSANNPTKRRHNKLPGGLPVERYAELQGCPEIGAALEEHRSSKAYAVHVIGNGVPRAMGAHVADAAARWWRGVHGE